MNTTLPSILFLVFNRPEETTRVLETIRNARPSHLFIAADGPRDSKHEDMILCEEVRKIVTQNIDWPCEVITRFQEKNLGCRKHVSSSIDWFFEQTEEGIILEDDCLPDASFFTFTSAMLEKYRTNEKIMHVSGSNFQCGQLRGDGNPPSSYYFSHCDHIWGWATWKRAWKTYDVDMKDLDEYIISKKIYSLFKDRKVARFWLSLFKHIKQKNIDTWDAQWAYAIIKSEGLAVTPNLNLVENIGFGISSTHTNEVNEVYKQKRNSMEFIIDPLAIEVDKEADDFLAKTLYIEPLWKKMYRKLRLK